MKTIETYKSPSIKVVPLLTQSVLCQSDFGGEDWEEVED